MPWREAATSAALPPGRNLKEDTSAGEKPEESQGWHSPRPVFFHDLRWQLSPATGGKIPVGGGKPSWCGLQVFLAHTRRWLRYQRKVYC